MLRYVSSSNVGFQSLGYASASIMRRSINRMGPLGMRFLSTHEDGKVSELQSFEDFKSLVGNKEKLTVVDFYATWCGPCKALEPIFQALAQKIPEVQFGRVDVDQQTKIAHEYAISAMPTFIYFKDGDKVDTIVGADPARIVSLISEHSGVDLSKK